MRIKVTFESRNGDIMLPIHHNSTLQGLIYSIFSESVSNHLHDKGFLHKKRSFKLFHFSRIIEKGTIVQGRNQKYFKFGRYISFYIASPINSNIEDFGEETFTKREFLLSNQILYLSRIEIIMPPVFTPCMRVKMISPVTMYSTLTNHENKKVVHYYNPNEEMFNTLIESNLKKKLEIVTRKDAKNLAFYMKPFLFSFQRNRKVIIMKESPIECWTGVYVLYGNPELLKISYEAGLGCKNSIGMGMWDVWESKNHFQERNGERDDSSCL
jgi:CRISPR-associated endoribonuclease Cas6